MQRTSLLALVVGCGAVVCGPMARAVEPTLTSRAIDPTLFRDGAIARFSGVAGAWGYVCDDVAGLKQRFCSLRADLRDASGVPVGVLIVSTGEDGRPAALLKIKADTFGPDGIAIMPGKPVAVVAPKSGGKSGALPKASVPSRIYPAACTQTLCQLVWTLLPTQIEALRTGAGWQLKGTPLDATVSGEGFAAAVDASLKPRDAESIATDRR
jgi:hypothetical protein